MNHANEKIAASMLISYVGVTFMNPVTRKQNAYLKPVKKGEPGRNPTGYNGKFVGMKEMKMLAKEQVQEMTDIVLKQDLEGLKRIIKDPASTVFMVWTAQIAAKAIQKGDVHAWEVILNRLIGKVPTPLVGVDDSPLIPTEREVVVILPAKNVVTRD